MQTANTHLDLALQATTWCLCSCSLAGGLHVFFIIFIWQCGDRVNTKSIIIHFVIMVTPCATVKYKVSLAGHWVDWAFAVAADKHLLIVVCSKIHTSIHHNKWQPNVSMFVVGYGVRSWKWICYFSWCFIFLTCSWIKHKETASLSSPHRSKMIFTKWPWVGALHWSSEELHEWMKTSSL